MRKLCLVVLVILCLAAVLPASAADIRATVVFKSATLPANAAAIVQSAGGTVISSIPEIGTLVATGPAGMLDKLNSNGAIASASPTLTVTLEDTKTVESDVVDTGVTPGSLWSSQWDVQQMTNSGASYDVNAGSHNTVVGIIDTGVRATHTALKANFLGGRNFYPDGPGGTVDPNDLNDRHGHGTHVAGSIAGYAAMVGVGPKLGFRMYRVFHTGGTTTDLIIQAMVAATNDGVDVISMSIGGYDEMAIGYWTDPNTGTVYKFKDISDFQAYRRAVQYALKAGIPVVVAAGNDATDIGNPAAVTAFLNAAYGNQGYVFQGASREVAGTLPGVLTVAATGPNSVFATYSNYGPGAIDISAPGGDSTRYPNPGWYTDMCLSSYRSSDISYAWMSGTSMATPKTAAVVALVIDQAKAKGIHLMPSQAVNQVLNSAVDSGKVGYDQFFGKGIANAFYALTK